MAATRLNLSDVFHRVQPSLARARAAALVSDAGELDLKFQGPESGVIPH